MEYSEFKRNFDSLQICHEVDGDETDSSKAGSKSWLQHTFESKWEAGTTAGGDDSQELFGMNPQILLDFDETDEEIVIEVMQKHRRERGKPNLSIGFKLYYKPPEMDVPLEAEYLLNTKPLAGVFRQTGKLWNNRSVLDRFRAIRKSCILVVYTEKPGVEGDIMIRILLGKAQMH